MQDQGFLGVACEKTDLGLKIISVVEKSAAKQSGLKVGDYLISLDGEKLDSREELTILISLKKPNELISLEYHRGSTELSVQLALGARPQK